MGFARLGRGLAESYNLRPLYQCKCCGSQNAVVRRESWGGRGLAFQAPCRREGRDTALGNLISQRLPSERLVSLALGGRGRYGQSHNARLRVMLKPMREMRGRELTYPVGN